MHIGGRWGARPAVAAVRRGACRLTRAPAFGVAAIAPLVFASAVGWAAGYATGVFPVDLPPITGPPPPLGDAHLENPEGLGPGLPINVNGLTADGPMAHLPLIDLTPRQAALNPPPMFPWMAPDPSAPMPGCTLICIGSHGPPVGAPPFPPTAPPPPFLPAAPPPPDPLAGPPGDAGLAPPAPAPAG